MLKQPLRSPRPRPGEAKRGQVPCRARRHGDLQSDFVVAWVRSMPLPPGALACHLAINCGLGLPLRNAGGDLRFLAVDVAEADIAISPSWPSRERLAICLRHRKAKWACRYQRGAAEKRKAQLQRPLQISTTLFGNSSGFSAPGGKCRASCSPHNSTAATKPSPGRPSLIAEIIAATALDHTSGVTLALIPLSATISAYTSAAL